MPAPIAAATPLAPALLNLNAGAWLSFAKMEAWIGEMNRCLASRRPRSPPTRIAPIATARASYSASYLNDGYDFASDFKVLMSGSRAGGTGFSAPAATHVVGSTLRDPVLLFVGKYVGSTSTLDDLAMVQVDHPPARRRPEHRRSRGHPRQPLDADRVHEVPLLPSRRRARQRGPRRQLDPARQPAHDRVDAAAGRVAAGRSRTRRARPMPPAASQAAWRAAFASSSARACSTPTRAPWSTTTFTRCASPGPACRTPVSCSRRASTSRRGSSC